MTKSEQLKRDAEFEITHPNDPDYGKKAYLFRMGKLEEYINAVIAERMPSEEEMESEIDRSPADMAFAGGFAECYEWLCSRLTNPGDSQKTEGGTK